MKIFEEAAPCEPDEVEGGLFSKSIDIKRCWVKYGLSLLEISWMRLTSEEMQQSLGVWLSNLRIELTFIFLWLLTV